MAKQPKKYDLRDGEWVEFVGKIPMAKMEELLGVLKSGEDGESDFALAKRMAKHIPSIVHAWSLESDPKSAEAVLWEQEDAQDLFDMIKAMSEYIQSKINTGN